LIGDSTYGSGEKVIMLIKVFVAVAAIFVLLAVIVATQPSEFRVARSIVMSAPAPAVFAQVNDFHKWEVWNPWGKIDPSMKQNHEGAHAGRGAIYTWAGNNEVGEGRMTITESRQNDLIRIKLEFFKPFAGTNTAEFTFNPEGHQTAVTWSMSGKNNLIARPFIFSSIWIK
jgi:Polyketide cyclase / dehydrase and lipid transport